MMMQLILVFFFIQMVFGKLPCDYLKMIDDKLMVEPGTIMCLGTCPDSSKMNKKGIYLSPGQNLYFENFILSTGENEFTIKDYSKTTVLHCFSDEKQCFAGFVPKGFPNKTKSSGFYLTGQAGGTSISNFDPWSTISTLQLDADSTLSQVVLAATTSEYPIHGWRLTNTGSTKKYSYIFTDREQLIVGEVDSALIYSNPGSAVIANGPVLVREGERGCPVPLPRKKVPAIILIYAYEEMELSTCDLSQNAKNFAYSVELNKCLLSPVDNPLSVVPMVNTIFQGTYFKVTTKEIDFYAEPDCATPIHTDLKKQLKNPCQQGWSGIILPTLPMEL